MGISGDRYFDVMAKCTVIEFDSCRSDLCSTTSWLCLRFLICEMKIQCLLLDVTMGLNNILPIKSYVQSLADVKHLINISF